MATVASTASRPAAAAGAGERGSDSYFEASTFERSLGPDEPRRWIGWRRRALVLAALLGCLAVFVLARWLAWTPQLAGEWSAGTAGELVLHGSALPLLDAHRGSALVAISEGAGPALAVDALLLHRWPRWQVDDGVRGRQVAQHEGLARMLARDSGTLRLHFADGTVVDTPEQPRGYIGLGLLFWPFAALALLLYLFAVVVLLARPQARNLLFVTMALCQAGNLLFIAVRVSSGLGLPVGLLAVDMPLRVGLDLCTAAAAVQLFALHPRRLQRAVSIAGAGWFALALWVWLAWEQRAVPMWWTAQLLCLALGCAALAVAWRQHRIEANPYALVMMRLAAAALASLALVTTAVAIAARVQASPTVAAITSMAWHLFIASLLLLTPFLARSRQVLREFALLAGVSTVATSLDLLFVAVFSLGTFTSLAMAVFIGVGLYAGARQWVLNHFIGASVLTTERAFDQLYRAARELQAHPRRYPELLARLLRELFDPLAVLRVDRVPVRSRLVGGGAALVVPMRSGDDEPAGAAAPSKALVLRFAQRGQRLFTLEDARLADRMVDHLRRAVAYDAAVERGRFEERQRLAQDLHDDIGARLLTLMYQAPTSEMEDYIRHTLQDLKTLTRGLAASEHRLSHAAAEWKSDLTQRLTAARVSLGWSFNVDRDRALTVVQWSALTRVLRELVSNALYHGHATQIDVAFTLEGTLLTLQISDDGEGRAPQAWAHGLGLGGVRKRVKLLGGEVAWRENGARGIVCEVRVPDFESQS